MIRARIATPPTATAAATGCWSRSRTSPAHGSAKLRLDRCGIGFGGPVNFAEQRVSHSTHVGGWNDFNFCQELTRHLEIPVIMDNDANVGALGEANLRRGPRHRRRCST